MEIEATANIRITKKEAEYLASKIAAKLYFHGLINNDADERHDTKTVIKNEIEDYEFESEVIVNVEPEERDEP